MRRAVSALVANNARHTERCKKCKESIQLHLAARFGSVAIAPKIAVPTHLEDYKGKSFHGSLKQIYQDLSNLRGRGHFVRAARLRSSDFLLEELKQLVEVDESQHFTLARATSLKAYPRSLTLGFNRKEWIQRCSDIDAKDDDPPYRDEQRAWYDTLRDFLPHILAMRPTIRIFAGAFRWCSLSSESAEDRKKFQVLAFTEI